MPGAESSDGLIEMQIVDLIKRLVDADGSDLYLKVGVPPTIRTNGELEPTEISALTEQDTKGLALEVLTEYKRQELGRHGDAEIAVSFAGLGRFRINCYSQRGMTGVVIRRVITRIPEIEELGLPPVVTRLAEEPRGLVLLTGPSGTGKTTTIAAMIGHINRNRRCHIVTLEDPIEVVHEDGLALIDQREVGTDMPSYADGLKYAVRQDPDVIFIGEIRDEETAEAAMQAAETGHLVISTMHTTDARETVSRLIDLFPVGRQRQARYSVASTLSAVVCQRLVPRADGEGRLPAVEVLVVNGRVVDLILDPSRTDHIHEVIREGGFYGMQTFDQALLELVRNRSITIEDAQLAASNRHDFMLALTEAQLIRRRA
jgi:twitching motility protein PilT